MWLATTCSAPPHLLGCPSPADSSDQAPIGTQVVKQTRHKHEVKHISVFSWGKCKANCFGLYLQCTECREGQVLVLLIYSNYIYCDKVSEHFVLFNLSIEILVCL